MLYSKSPKLTDDMQSPNRAPNPEQEGLKPLVDHAIECARNANYRAAKKALAQAKKRLAE